MVDKACTPAQAQALKSLASFAAVAIASMWKVANWWDIARGTIDDLAAQWLEYYAGVTKEERAWAEKYRKRFPEKGMLPPTKGCNTITQKELAETAGVHLPTARLAGAAYSDCATLSAGLGTPGWKLDDLHLLPCAPTSIGQKILGGYLPAYHVLYNKEGTVYVTIRGTWGLRDVFCDYQAGSVTVNLGGNDDRAGYAHNGMKRAAELLLKHEQENILSINGGRVRKIIFVGHSLGGGVAALAAFLGRFSAEWRKTFANVEFFAVTFGAPHILSKELAELCFPFITSYIHRRDPVPRLSLGSIWEAFKQIKEDARLQRDDEGYFGWQDEHEKGGKWFNDGLVHLYNAGMLIHITDSRAGALAQMCDMENFQHIILPSNLLHYALGPRFLLYLWNQQSGIASHKCQNYIIVMDKLIQQQSMRDHAQKGIIGMHKGSTSGPCASNWRTSQPLLRPQDVQLVSFKDIWYSKKDYSMTCTVTELDTFINARKSPRQRNGADESLAQEVCCSPWDAVHIIKNLSEWDKQQIDVVHVDLKDADNPKGAALKVNPPNDGRSYDAKKQYVERLYQEMAIEAARLANEREKKESKWEYLQKLAWKEAAEEYLKVNPRDALFRACSDGNLDAVRGILPRCSETSSSWFGGFRSYFKGLPAGVSHQNSIGLTPLHCAVQSGNVDVVNLLLCTGHADVNKADKRGRTPLHVAAGIGGLELVEHLLISGNVDVDKPDKDGRTPLHLAALNEFKSLGDHYGVVVRLISTGAVEVDRADSGGQTPLHFAAAQGNLEVVKHLLSTGQVNMHKADKGGFMPTSLALQKGNTDIVKYLARMM